MFKVDLISLLAIFGSFNSILVALILATKYNNLHNKLLALLLCATSIRIAKNIVVHIRVIDPDLQLSNELWRFMINFGISHQFAIGPLFLLYIQSWTQQEFRFAKGHWIHFIPYFMLVSLSTWLPWEFWRDIGLWASYISILVYFLIALYFHTKSLNSDMVKNASVVKWLNFLMIFTSVLLVAYSPALFKYIGYIGGAGMYAAGLFAALLILTINKRFHNIIQTKYRNHQLPDKEREQIIEKIEHLLRSQLRLFDPDISLNSIADDLNINHTLVSRAINQSMGVSFSKYINQLRIEEAQARLKDPTTSHLKIAAIAFDCGFNAISTFNTAFKEYTGVTPKQYRKQFYKE